jgi:hypothetical protein
VSAFCCASTTTSPSTPAVLRPALSCVTLRTDSSALLRERSINFCRLRTRFRSPARDAAKIRCRNRRTSPSIRRQSTASHSRSSPSGPFTTAASTAASAASSVVVASNLPLGSSVDDHHSSQAHLIRVSTLSGRGNRPYPAGYADTTGGGTSIAVPVSRRLSAAGIRFSDHPAPAERSAFLTVSPPGSDCLGPDGIVTFRTRQIRPGRVPSVPRGRRCAPTRPNPPGWHLSPHNDRPLPPARTSHRARVLMTRRQRGFTRFTRPAFPSL